ncbi:MAG: hypothetical protein F8N36_12000 [Desulfovibrio sp.]|uniref:hypothetical protein n=1 Tax=Desulfovibrio sp. TaxID=885 RepID=UPI00135DC05E|nr:hypothetical protein [Desulfovibrio sp.]MTJ93570.1 hypothetical protein [Desulfovibrio sp.]
MDVKPIIAWPKTGPAPQKGKALVLEPKRGWVVAEVDGWGWKTVPGGWQVRPTHYCDLRPKAGRLVQRKIEAVQTMAKTKAQRVREAEAGHLARNEKQIRVWVPNRAGDIRQVRDLAASLCAARDQREQCAPSLERDCVAFTSGGGILQGGTKVGQIDRRALQKGIRWKVRLNEASGKPGIVGDFTTLGDAKSAALSALSASQQAVASSAE